MKSPQPCVSQICTYRCSHLVLSRTPSMTHTFSGGEIFSIVCTYKYMFIYVIQIYGVHVCTYVYLYIYVCMHIYIYKHDIYLCTLIKGAIAAFCQALRVYAHLPDKIYAHTRICTYKYANTQCICVYVFIYE